MQQIRIDPVTAMQVLRIRNSLSTSAYVFKLFNVFDLIIVLASNSLDTNEASSNSVSYLDTRCLPMRLRLWQGSERDNG